MSHTDSNFSLHFIVNNTKLDKHAAPLVRKHSSLSISILCMYQYIYIYYFENISFFFVFDISISPSSFPHLVFTQRKTISGVHMFIFPYCPVLSNKLFLNANKFLGILKIQKELPMAVFQ